MMYELIDCEKNLVHGRACLCSYLGGAGIETLSPVDKRLPRTCEEWCCGDKGSMAAVRWEFHSKNGWKVGVCSDFKNRFKTYGNVASYKSFCRQNDIDIEDI